MSPVTTYSLNLPETSKPVRSGHLKVGGRSRAGDEISANSYYLTFNNRPFFGVSGEFQFSRYPSKYWEEELRKIKAGGINVLATYLFWIHHEPQPGQFDWRGNRDIRRFVQLCQHVGLSVIARIGPFAHGECRNGGMPDWLYGLPFEPRSNQPEYLALVERYYSQIGAQLRGLWFAQGGPIIGMQLDNEYMHTGAPWDAADRSQGIEWLTSGREGVSHLSELRRLARKAGMEAPLLTFTAWGSPIIPDESLPVYGGYAYPVWVAEEFASDLYLFTDQHALPTRPHYMGHEPNYYPVMNAEMQGGIQVRYTNRPVVPARSSEALALVKIGGGSNFLGYYIYHGGSNPQVNGHFTNEINHPQVSYDFQAPIGEYGEVRDACRYLKLLHLFLQAYGEQLAPLGVALPPGAETIKPEDTSPLRFCARADAQGRGFLFLNNFQDHVAMPPQEDFRLELACGGQKISIPTQGSLTLPADVCCIWPLNLEMEGAQLRFATVQPLTILKTDSDTHYVFFETPGIQPQYAFAAASLDDLQGDFHARSQAGDLIVLEVQPGWQHPFTFRAANGKSVRVTTLTRHEAEHAWRGAAWNQERLVISEADIFFIDGGMEMRSLGQASAQVTVFPPVAALKLSAGTLQAAANGEHSTSFTVALPPHRGQVDIERRTETKYKLSFTDELMTGVNDVFLQVDYEGDTAAAFINGRLVADHYNNGTPWLIGLKRFFPEILAHGLVLKFRPLNKGTVKNISSPMASRAVFEGEQLLKLKEIKLIPEYAVRLG